MPTGNLRNVRVDTEVWEAAKSYAALHGTTVSWLIVNYLKTLVTEKPMIAKLAAGPDCKHPKTVKLAFGTWCKVCGGRVEEKADA